MYIDIKATHGLLEDETEPMPTLSFTLAPLLVLSPWEPTLEAADELRDEEVVTLFPVGGEDPLPSAPNPGRLRASLGPAAWEGL